MITRIARSLVALFRRKPTLVPRPQVQTIPLRRNSAAWLRDVNRGEEPKITHWP